MNLNYVGSLAQMRMKFRSTTDVVVNNQNELFNAMSIYVPKRFAAQNIIGWDDNYVSPERPAVFVAVVDNYVKIMTGDLLAQWQPIFRQDTNSAVIIYLIVFDDEVADGWVIQNRMIAYNPLSLAFQALFSFSFFKFLFDPFYDGRDVMIPASPGTPSEMRVRLMNQTRGGTFARQDVLFVNPLAGTPGTAGTLVVTVNNPTGAAIDIPAGTYAITGGFGYNATLGAVLTVAVGGNQTMTFTALSNGVDVNQPVVVSEADISGLPVGLTAVLDTSTQGAAATGNSLILEAGTYTYNDGTRIWNILIPQEFVLEPNGGSVVIPNVRPTTMGAAPNLAEGMDITNLFYGKLPPAGVVVTSTNIINGTNPGDGNVIVIQAGTYNYNDGNKTFAIDIPTLLTMRPDDVSSQVSILATINGVNPNLGQGLLENNIIDPRAITPELPLGILVTVISTRQGTDPVAQPYTAPSMFFDLSLALAFQCKNNIALSWMWSLVKVSYDMQKPNPQDRCWIRYATRAQQLEAVNGPDGPSLLAASRSRYYWAMLMLMECQNTTVLIHSEFQYIIADVLAEWFGRRNASGTFIGNKLSLLRLSGTRIKPLGWPSWLDSSVNENDADGHQQLRDMNVGHLATIADNTPQESYLTMARGVGDIDAGIPVSMQMIAKFVDYTCSMETAKMITDKGTLTNPVMTDEIAYESIQRLVAGTLGRFAGTNGRIFNVVMMFPDFRQAKVSRTALSAASAWKGWYKDDLDQVEVSGGLISE